MAQQKKASNRSVASAFSSGGRSHEKVRTGSQKSCDLDSRIKRMEVVVERACRTPQAARALLIETGILTKKGNLKNQFQS